MDPVAAIGTVSAILSIASEFEHLCKRLRRFIKSFKHAPAELKMVHNEADVFWQLLEKFHEFVEEDDAAQDGFSANIQNIKISERIAQASRFSLQRLRDMLVKFEPLRSRNDRSLRARLQKWLALWQWSGWKEEWALIQLSLNSTKHNAQLLLTMVSFEAIFRKIRTLELENTAIPEKLMRQLDRCKKNIKSLQRSVRRLRRQCEQQDLENEERQAFQINVVLTQETGGVVRAYIERHQDIKTVLNSDAPASSVFEERSTISPSTSAEVGAGSQTSSQGATVNTPDTSLDDESFDSPGELDCLREEIIEVPDKNNDLWEGTKISSRGHSECRSDLDLKELTQEELRKYCWAALQAPFGHTMSLPNPGPESPHDAREDDTVNREDDSGGRYEYPPPRKPQVAARGKSVSRPRQQGPQPSTSDDPAQDIVVDRNDGLGVRHEYRPPRKPRRSPSSLD
ncbi:hypothetical protein LTR10_023745 [Elasticomyces elasticus]|uniref:Fungal N-terminal domain-containing protein n=1 Tax=Exophiala sideris TaxID=1016849 RepID=A0ABR0IVQ3_9EURO|nr:hypothetical protein LTR10_023745 [Elasticomyces elasticus]KAK5021545.1 hypothetical protein LTS07_010952 [Exophiala sideris]KAK5024535.1 hypothetical protein LTR13_010791 [Exophiala sideris]KAK5049680.1 hypothetical protein LTR69_010976 [Exophiala sideris]KAK5176661.1 hypothetical protein LTR44_010843 [Eurotiomycetes sp. CCFEE 6388]